MLKVGSSHELFTFRCCQPDYGLWPRHVVSQSCPGGTLFEVGNFGRHAETRPEPAPRPARPENYTHGECVHANQPPFKTIGLLAYPKPHRMEDWHNQRHFFGVRKARPPDAVYGRLIKWK